MREPMTTRPTTGLAGDAPLDRAASPGAATETAVGYTTATGSVEAGRDLGEQIRDRLREPADIVVVFVSARYESASLLRALSDTCHPTQMIGASSAGEITRQASGEGFACALAIRSTE